MAEKACKKCKRVVETKVDTCPTCGSEEFSRNWKGIVHILNPEKSKIAQEMEIKTPGKYALRVS